MGDYDLIKRQFIEGNLPSGSILNKVLAQLPPEDVARLRTKAAEGMLGIELEQIIRGKRFEASSVEIREFIDNVKQLEWTTKGSIGGRYTAEGEFRGASGTTKITVKKGCYIATAVYGSKTHPNVELLRTFRDSYLDVYWVGRFLCQLYYKFSPLFAESNVISGFRKPIMCFLDFLCNIAKRMMAIK